MVGGWWWWWWLDSVWWMWQMDSRFRKKITWRQQNSWMSITFLDVTFLMRWFSARMGGILSCPSWKIGKLPLIISEELRNPGVCWLLLLLSTRSDQRWISGSIRTDHSYVFGVRPGNNLKDLQPGFRDLPPEWLHDHHPQDLTFFKKKYHHVSSI